ncbi:Ribonuclease H-like superfamily [Sesbania bispinosa]|nr:Ribonuclease H-like superfamily [Sesbania bispinosa]
MSANGARDVHGGGNSATHNPTTTTKVNPNENPVISIDCAGQKEIQEEGNNCPLYGDWITDSRNRKNSKLNQRQTKEPRADKGKEIQVADPNVMPKSAKTWVKKRQRKDSSSPDIGLSSLVSSKAQEGQPRALTSSNSFFRSWADGTWTSLPLVRVGANRFSFEDACEPNKPTKPPDGPVLSGMHVSTQKEPPDGPDSNLDGMAILTNKESPNGNETNCVDAIVHVEQGHQNTVTGAKSKRDKRFVKNLVRTHKSSLCFILETHCHFQPEMSFWSSLGYVHCAIVEAQNHSRGIWVFKEQAATFQIDIVDIFHQAITFHCTMGSYTWMGSVVYASPIPTARETLCIHLIGWDRISVPRKDGGLGLRRARLSNTSLLGKLVWKMMHERDSLWVQVLSHKYIKTCSLLSAPTPPTSSIVWRSIIKAKDALKNGYSMEFNSGATSVWYKDWTSLGCLCHQVPYVHISDTNMMVRDLWQNGAWDLSSTLTVIPDHILEIISHLPLPAQINEDADVWRWTTNTLIGYTARSGYYWLLDSVRRDHNLGTWRWVWRLKALEKVVWSRIGIQDGETHDVGVGDNFRTWLIKNIRGPQESLFLSSLWWLWKWRNNIVFENHPWTIDSVVRNILVMKDEMIHSVVGDRNDAQIFSTLWWQPPPVGYTKLNLDGSYNHSNNIMGSGGVMRDANGTWLWGFSGCHEPGNALLLELLAIKEGLTIAWEHNHRKFICEFDCLEALLLLQNVSSSNDRFTGLVLAEVRELLARN